MASGGVPRIRYACDTDKSVLVNNFDKRGWVSVSSDDDWNFYWYGLHFLFMKKWTYLSFLSHPHTVNLLQVLIYSLCACCTGQQFNLSGVCSVLRLATDCLMISKDFKGAFQSTLRIH